MGMMMDTRGEEGNIRPMFTATAEIALRGRGQRAAMRVHIAAAGRPRDEWPRQSHGAAANAFMQRLEY
jgi:hypothetical protein